MKGIKKGLAFGSMMVGLLLAGACTEEDLDRRTSGYVEITLNWPADFDADASASVDESGKAVADGGRIYFFPESGDAFYRDCTKGKDGKEKFEGWLPVGNYRIITMNRNRKNTSDLVDENDRVVCSYESARLDVKNVVDAVAIAATKAATDAPLIGQPASVFLSHGFDGNNDVLTVKASRDKIDASTSPQSMVKRVHFTITVENFTVRACHCVFGGIARAILCSTCTCIQEPARLAFDAMCGTDDPNRFTATFNVFDLVEPGVLTHPLELALELDSGETKTTTVDLSDRVKESLDSGEFSYELPLDLDIKVLQNIDGTIQATVEEWADGGSGSGTGGYDKD